VTSPHLLITGAARGIGLALARHFLARNWLVSGVDLGEAGISAPDYRHHKADITDEPALDRAFDEALKQGPLDVVIANAALTDLDHRQAVDLDYKTWQRIMRVNIDGAFLTGRSAARRMRGQGGGNIIFVTSSLAFLDQAKANDAPYCASKSAVEMLAQVLARELAPDGINVNTLFPSVKIDTGFFAHLPDAERSALARPDLLNETALFLAGLRPGALTGTSVDQQLWDEDSAYRQSLREGSTQ